MFHAKAVFPDPVFCKVEFDGEDLAVCFKVLLENAIVFDPSVFINQQSVDEEICNDPVPFVFGKKLECCHKIDVVGTLPKVGTGCIHDAEVEPEVQAPVNIAAEYGFEKDFFLSALFIAEFRKCFEYPVILYTIVLKKVTIGCMDSKVEAAVFEKRIGDEVAVSLADVALGFMESGLFQQWVIILVARECGI